MAQNMAGLALLMLSVPLANLRSALVSACAQLLPGFTSPEFARCSIAKHALSTLFQPSHTIEKSS